MRTYEPQRRGDVVPFGERRDFEARPIAFTPHAGGAKQLPGRDDVVDLLGLNKLLETKHLRLRRGASGEPGEIIGMGLAIDSLVRRVRTRRERVPEMAALLARQCFGREHQRGENEQPDQPRHWLVIGSIRACGTSRRSTGPSDLIFVNNDRI